MPSFKKSPPELVARFGGSPASPRCGTKANVRVSSLRRIRKHVHGPPRGLPLPPASCTRARRTHRKARRPALRADARTADDRIRRHPSRDHRRTHHRRLGAALVRLRPDPPTEDTEDTEDRKDSDGARREDRHDQPATNKQWRSGVLDVSKASGDGAGAIYRQIMKGPGGRKIRGDYRVTDFERPTRLAFEVIAGPARPTGSYELRPETPTSTSVTFTLDLKPRELPSSWAPWSTVKCKRKSRRSPS